VRTQIISKKINPKLLESEDFQECWWMVTAACRWLEWKKKGVGSAHKIGQELELKGT
jgi:hypothetical protein